MGGGGGLGITTRDKGWGWSVGGWISPPDIGGGAGYQHL